MKDLASHYAEFLRTYDEPAKSIVWRQQSDKFHEFWTTRIVGNGIPDLSDEECDAVIRFLDRNGKGNTKTSESVAKAMIPQGAWRRMFHEFRRDARLREAVSNVLTAGDVSSRGMFIDALYKLNQGRKNNLTGPSGNAICAFLALQDPVRNVSVISLRDRKSLLDYLGVALTFDWDLSSIGQRIATSNDILLDAFVKRGLSENARTASEFCYSPQFLSQWKDVHTVKRVGKDVEVIVPTSAEPLVAGVEDRVEPYGDELRESMQVQALLARIGAGMGFSIWLPRADRGRVTKAWKPGEGELLEDLPLGYDTTTLKTIEQIDVLWLRRRTIIRAFEVEHTTSVYSGLLRMADLIALQPNLNIKLHIVAPESKHDKVLQEIRRPVFALLEGCPLADLCTYLSYTSVREIADSKLLSHLSDTVLEEYEESAD